MLFRAIDHHIPQRTLKRRSRPPWIDNEIMKLIRKKKKHAYKDLVGILKLYLTCATTTALTPGQSGRVPLTSNLQRRFNTSQVFFRTISTVSLL